jgi:hypothetical protein
MERSFFSLPPSLASRLLLSPAIKDSKPSLTKEVFSLTPVSRDAFSNILSSMLSVVLICINMYQIYIHVKYKILMIHSGSGLHNRLEHLIGTYGDAAFAAAAFLGVFNDHMPVKPEVHFPQYVVFAFFDTRPAGFAFFDVRTDMFCTFSS